MSLSQPFAVQATDFYTQLRTAGDPPGGYAFFVAVVKAGALAGGTIPPDQIPGAATA